MVPYTTPQTKWPAWDELLTTWSTHRWLEKICSKCLRVRLPILTGHFQPLGKWRSYLIVSICPNLSQTYKCTLSQIMGFLKQNLIDYYVHLFGNMLGLTLINLDYMICKSSNFEVSFDLVCCSPKHCKKRRDMVPLLSTCQATIDFCVKNQCHFYPVRHIMWKLLYLLTNNVLQGFISL